MAYHPPFVPAVPTMTSAVKESESTSTCVVCQDEFPKDSVLRCRCEHEYCRSCLTQLVDASLHDESLFPPRCCLAPVPIGDKPEFLAAQLVRELEAKQEEYSTPNRTYCHRQYCSKFIPARAIRGTVGTCIRCEMQTCINCNSAMHDNGCSENLAEQEVLRVAEDNEWKRCGWCQAVVEREDGCNHISKFLKLGLSGNYVSLLIDTNSLPLWSRILLPLWHGVAELRLRAVPLR